MLWIGLNDRDVEGDFVWVSGEPVTYTNWAPGEPNHLNHQDYVQMDHRDDGLWHDVTSESSQGPDHGVVEVIPPEAFALLPVEPGEAGVLNTWTTVDGTPDKRVIFFFCAAFGDVPVPLARCAHVNLDLLFARVLGSAIADAEGTASLERNLGAVSAGATWHFQALDVDTCEITDVVTTTF